MLAASAVILVASSCSTESPSAPGAPTREAVEAYAGAYYDAYLARFQAVNASTLEYAKARSGLWDRAPYLNRAWLQSEPGNRRIDDAMKNRCLSDIAAATDLETLTIATRSPDSACRRAFTGILANGADCTWDAECNVDSYCANPLAVCPGSCAPRLPAGSSCTLEEQYAECATRLACSLAPPAPGLCIEGFQDLGDPCGGSPNKLCRQGLTCVSSVCEVPLGLDEGPCASTWYCAATLYCDTVTSLCKPVKLLTESCTPGSCQPGARCAEGGTCVAQPSNGAPCNAVDAGDNANCLYGICGGSPATCPPIREFLASCSAGDACKLASFCDPARGICSGSCR